MSAAATADPRTGVVAFDPGLNGAYAVFLANGELWACDDLPRFDNGLDTVAVARLFSSYRPALTIIERVGARPHQGVASMFKFGFSCGVITGAASAWGAPIHYVAPTVWQKRFRLGANKSASRELASRLYPKFAGLARVRDHNRAEAILIGRYALDTIVRASEPEPAEEELVI